MTDHLKQTFIDFNQFSLEQIEYMISCFDEVELKKDEFLIKNGQVCDIVAFIKSGILRKFYLNEKGEEIVFLFCQDNQFVTSITSFVNQTYSVENIQAITDCKLLVITKEEHDKLYIQIPALQEFCRISGENLSILLENRINALLVNTAEERYETFLKSHPKLFNTVPLKFIASYLGITPQHLSRLRKKFGLKKAY